MPAKINIRQLRRELSPSIKQFAGLSYGAALSRFNSVKEDEIRKFKENEISKELNGGNTAEHKAGILDEGNLFSFIGFQENRKPADEVAEMLEEAVFLDKRPVIKESSDGKITFTFNVFTPSIKEIEEKTPLPWMSGRSWIKEIEEGISGLSRYVYHEFFRGGRSKTGLQLGKRDLSSRAKGIPYVTGFIKSLARRFSYTTKD